MRRLVGGCLLAVGVLAVSGATPTLAAGLPSGVAIGHVDGFGGPHREMITVNVAGQVSIGATAPLASGTFHAELDIQSFRLPEIGRDFGTLSGKTLSGVAFSDSCSGGFVSGAEASADSPDGGFTITWVDPLGQIVQYRVRALCSGDTGPITFDLTVAGPQFNLTLGTYTTTPR